MTGFDAYFYKSKIYINGKKEYTLGEILMKYLSTDFKKLDYLLYWCKRYIGLLHYPETMEEAKMSDEFFQGAIAFYDKLDDIICSLPPYNSLNPVRNRLPDLLNEDGALWELEYEDNNPEEKPLDYNFHYDTDLPLHLIEDLDLTDNVLKFNAKLKDFAQEYLTYIEDILRVKNVFEPFLEKIHSQSRYLDNNETAEIFADFMEENKGKLDTYKKLQPSGNMKISYTVLKQKESSVLCEQYHFDTIGAFLYIELFKGLEQHYLPKKCGYCGKYFLLEGGLFSDYCTRPVKGMEGKVCRDVGHRKKYADKVKNDPAWNVYIKAYKQHYARYMK